MDPIAILLSLEYNLILQEKSEIETIYIMNRKNWTEIEHQKYGDAVINLQLSDISKTESFNNILLLKNHSEDFCNLKIGETLEIYYDERPVFNPKFKSNDKKLQGILISSNFKNTFEVKIDSYIDLRQFKESKISLRRYYSVDSYIIMAKTLKKLITDFIKYSKTGLTTMPKHSFILFHSVYNFLRSKLKFNPPTYSLLPNEYFGFEPYQSNLNKEQLKSIRNSILAKNFYIIHGPPGTGKTTTIVEIILQLLRNNSKTRILVASSTNMAVDNIALKLLKVSEVNKIQLSSFLPVRIGTMMRVEEKLNSIKINEVIKKEYKDEFRGYDDLRNMLYSGMINGNYSSLTSNLVKEINAFERKIDAYRNAIICKSNLVFSTLMSCANMSDNENILDQVFDVLIIDEASQSRVGECLLPFKISKKVILGGDHHQLPPVIVTNINNNTFSYSQINGQENNKSNEYKTLFDLLMNCSLRNYISTRLNTQYRMNDTIMKFSSQRFYKEKLNSHETVKSHRMIDLKFKNPNMLYNKELFSSCMGYIDTTYLRYYDSSNFLTKSQYNFGEAMIVRIICEQLYEDCTEMSKIGIITPYLAQRNMILSQLSLSESICAKQLNKLEVNTVDSFQGREKEIIILSFVRSNIERDKYIGFLKDYRRLNVSITRARRLLIVIGDFGMLSNNINYEDFLNYVKNNGLNMMNYLEGHLENIEKANYEHMNNSYKKQDKMFDLQKKIKEGVSKAKAAIKLNK